MYFFKLSSHRRSYLICFVFISFFQFFHDLNKLNRINLLFSLMATFLCIFYGSDEYCYKLPFDLRSALQLFLYPHIHENFYCVWLRAFSEINNDIRSFNQMETAPYKYKQYLFNSEKTLNST